MSEARPLPAHDFDEVCSSADRELWLRERTTGIGSSDAPAVLGLNPWHTPLSVFAEKLGLEEPADENEAMYWGSKIEPLVLERFGRETGRDVTPAGVLLRSRSRPWQLATLDGMEFAKDRRGPGVLEVKCTSLQERWSDGVPDYVTAQVQHQLSVTGYAWASVAVLFGGREFFWADVERDEEFIAALVELEGEFWQRILRSDAPPAEASEIDRRILGKLYPKDSGAAVKLPGEMTGCDERRQELRAEIDHLSTELLGIENKLKQAIGEATTGLLSSGVQYTFKEQHRAECVMAASSFRVLRRKERK